MRYSISSDSVFRERQYNRLGGVVKNVLIDRGYGFLTLDDGREAFFHRSDVHEFVVWDTVRAGERVRFKLGQNERGLCALDVQRDDPD